ncbi:MAG: hypothetical protein DRP08_03795 [Candidatus Aenigmatarchaeota archaeon]|nr:MAG: hypothetical protein DRP08_03795 [Candidatus Aenigmarchaeota archaeon]
MLAVASDDQQEKIIVYYFHGSFRCFTYTFTYTNIEKYLREAIEANFKNDLVSGILEFKTVIMLLEK